MAQRVFETAGDALPLQFNGQETWADIDVFVTGHVLLSGMSLPLSLDIPFGSQQNARMDTIFLQRR